MRERESECIHLSTEEFGLVMLMIELRISTCVYNEFN